MSRKLKFPGKFSGFTKLSLSLLIAITPFPIQFSYSANYSDSAPGTPALGAKNDVSPTTAVGTLDSTNIDLPWSVVQLLKWIALNPSSGGSGGSGGAITAALNAYATGAIVDLGAKADSVAAGPTSTASLIALTKYANSQLNTLNTNLHFNGSGDLLTSLNTALDHTIDSIRSYSSDGDNATWGAKNDSPCGTDDDTCSGISLLKRNNDNITAANALITTLNGLITTLNGKFTLDGNGYPIFTLGTGLNKTDDAVSASQIAATQPAIATLQNAAGTGNPAGTSLQVLGYTTAILNVVSSTPMSGGTTINFEATVDDTVGSPTWVSISGDKVGSPGIRTSTTTSDGDFRFQVAGYKAVRARISGWSAGVTTVKGALSPLSTANTTVSVVSGKTIQRAPLSLSLINGNTQVVAAGTNKIKVLELFIMVDANCTITFKSGAGGTAIAGPFYLLANQGFHLPFPSNADADHFRTADATALSVTGTATANGGGFIIYTDEP